MHNEGYSTMCGHGIIALATVLIESGAFPQTGEETRIGIDTPAGFVRAVAYANDRGKVERVSFLNVPSFIYQRDLEVSIPVVGNVKLDIAFGGAFYAILPADRVGQEVHPTQIRELVEIAAQIKESINRDVTIQHPHDNALGFLYGVIFTGPPENSAHHSRNLCVFADSEVDRSPTGTGVYARLALDFAKDTGSIDHHREYSRQQEHVHWPSHGCHPSRPPFGSRSQCNRQRLHHWGATVVDRSSRLTPPRFSCPITRLLGRVLDIRKS
jgi:proline racemase